ncbi:MAG: CvpA family protein [Oscillospiraceae bacterium]|nr:CvpA family protein [Oscillospiraceae bacterium]
MDNALIIDGVLAAVLIVGALVGAKRGLFKSLMGLIAVVAALVGAVLLANRLTEPLTDFIAPKVENAIVEKFTHNLNAAESDGAAEDRGALRKLLEEYHLPADQLDGLLSSLSGTLSSVTGAAKEKAAEVFRNAISDTVRTTVSGAVHTALTLVFYALLLAVLRLLTKAIDHVFELPLLGTANDLGGALLGLLEAAALLYAVVYLANRFGVKFITEHAEDTYLLSFLLSHSPVELISSFTREA